MLTMVIFLQAISLEARPLVQRITLERALAGEGEVESQTSANVTCSLEVDLVRAGVVLNTVLLSSFHGAEDIQELLNAAIPKMSDQGQIAVRRRGAESEDERDWSWSTDSAVHFDVIYLTPLGLAASDIVTLAVCSTGDCVSCSAEGSNATEHDIMVTIETVQEYTLPESFQVAFNTGTPKLRNTEPLPLNVTNGMLHSKLTGLLSWDCTEEEDIAENTILYEHYESARTDNSTSFCGAYSARNRHVFWRGQNYRLDDVPYVSASP